MSNAFLGQLDDYPRLEVQDLHPQGENKRLTDSGNFSSGILCRAAEARPSVCKHRLKIVIDFIIDGSLQNKAQNFVVMQSFHFLQKKIVCVEVD